ncbi:MAG: hypothetical protein KKH92_08480 [Firmicutes bacterium]|nr:hypothetical protein [Bacillota bacterium]
MKKKSRFLKNPRTTKQIEQAEKAFKDFFESSAFSQMVSINTRIQEAGIGEQMRKAIEIAQKQASFMEPVLKQISQLQQIGNQVSGLSKLITIDFAKLFPGIEELTGTKIAIVPPQNRRLELEDTEQIIDEAFDKIKHSTGEGVISIFIDPESKEVFRAPRDESHYTFSSEDRMILLLSLTYQHISTSKLLDRTGYASERSVITTIQKIRKQISKSLGIDGDLIEGSVHKGYRISPKYRILYIEDFDKYGA